MIVYSSSLTFNFINFFKEDALKLELKNILKEQIIIDDDFFYLPEDLLFLKSSVKPRKISFSIAIDLKNGKYILIYGLEFYKAIETSFNCFCVDMDIFGNSIIFDEIDSMLLQYENLYNFKFDEKFNSDIAFESVNKKKYIGDIHFQMIILNFIHNFSKLLKKISQKEAKNQNFNETACKNSKNINILCSRDIFEEKENLKTNLPFIALFELIIFLDRFFENFISFLAFLNRLKKIGIPPTDFENLIYGIPFSEFIKDENFDSKDFILYLYSIQADYGLVSSLEETISSIKKKEDKNNRISGIYEKIVEIVIACNFNKNRLKRFIEELERIIDLDTLEDFKKLCEEQKDLLENPAISSSQKDLKISSGINELINPSLFSFTKEINSLISKQNFKNINVFFPANLEKKELSVSISIKEEKDIENLTDELVKLESLIKKIWDIL